MPVALNCRLRADAMPTLTALRGDHLAYIRAHLEEILFGGPARDAGGVPEEMIIVLHTDDRARAEAFIAAEPYSASGRVFENVKVRIWSQVVPEPQPGALEAAIAAERSGAAG
ncbi:YciI family protein [Sphingomonas koreensis]|nr:YciI family protein [Sphingomonas koreensis]